MQKTRILAGAIAFPGTVAGTGFVGYLVGKQFDAVSAGVAVGVVLGMVVAFAEILMLVKQKE